MKKYRVHGEEFDTLEEAVAHCLPIEIVEEEEEEEEEEDVILRHDLSTPCVIQIQNRYGALKGTITTGDPIWGFSYAITKTGPKSYLAHLQYDSVNGLQQRDITLVFK